MINNVFLVEYVSLYVRFYPLETGNAEGTGEEEYFVEDVHVQKIFGA